VAGTASHPTDPRWRRGDPYLDEVAAGVYAYVQPEGGWYVNTMGFVAGGDAVVAVDTSSTEQRTRGFLDAIRSVTAVPIGVLVNTHHHGDHTFGNWLVHEKGAVIAGHRRCREEVLATGIEHYEGVFDHVDHGDIRLCPPQVTFEDSLTLWVDDRAVELHYIGAPAHTTNDIVAWLPDRRVLFAGDLVFCGGTPFVLMGSLSGALRSVERLRRLGPQVVVPGHGPVCDASVLGDMEAYYRFVEETARRARAAGLTPLAAARETDLGAFAELSCPERLVGNLHRAYAELDGTPPGAPIDMAAAMRDTLILNGGHPLRCSA
jgi:cyclase